MKRKMFSWILVVTLVMSVVACGKKEEPPITPVEEPALPYQGEQESGVSELPDVSQEDSHVHTLATTADEWSEDLMHKDMRDFLTKLKDAGAFDELTSSGSSGNSNVLNLTGEEEVPKEEPKDDGLTLDHLNFFMLTKDMLENFGGVELGKEGKITWGSSDELANLMGFASNGAMLDAGVGGDDLTSMLFGGLSEAFGNSDVSFSSVDKDDVIVNEGIFSYVDDVEFERDGDTGKVWMEAEGVDAIQCGDAIYFIGLAGYNGRTIFGSSLQYNVYSDTPDGAGINGSVTADWKKVFDEAESKGHISASNADCIVVKDIPFFVIAESELETMDSKDDFEALLYDVTSGFDQEFDWSGYFSLESDTSVESEESTVSDEEMYALFNEYLGVSEDSFSGTLE